MNLFASDLTLQELASALATSLSLSLRDSWSVSLPRGPDPREAWLHGKQREAAALRVVPGALEAWFDGVRERCLVERRADLEGGCRWAVRAVQRQHAQFARNLAATERAWALADEVLALLRAELPTQRLKVQRSSSASHAASGCAYLHAAGPARVIVEISAEQGALELRAGLPPRGASAYVCRADALDRALLVRAVRDALEEHA